MARTLLQARDVRPTIQGITEPFGLEKTFKVMESIVNPALPIPPSAFPFLALILSFGADFPVLEVVPCLSLWHFFAVAAECS